MDSQRPWNRTLFPISIWGQILSGLAVRVPRLSPPFVIPANAGTQGSANGKTEGKPGRNTINQIAPDLGSRLRGNDESAIVFGPQGEKLIKIVPQIISKNL